MFCLDTNNVIFALNGRRPSIDRRLQAELSNGTALYVPSIVLFELRYGLAKSKRRPSSQLLLDTFFERGFEFLDFDGEDATEAGDIRAQLEKTGTPIGPYDILIAAQARRRNLSLVTLNREKFSRVPGLSLSNWES